MIDLKLIDIANICEGELVLPHNVTIEEFDERYPEGFVISSLEVKKDYIFVASKGENTDGHKYIPNAFAAGALAVICERVPEDAIGPCIVVKDSLEAFIHLAHVYRDTFDIKIVSIIGSVGKTSTKEFIASVLKQKYKLLKGAGNHNNMLGLSLEVMRFTRDLEMAVLEMGISDFGEMTELAKFIRPDMVIFTNVGECHLDNLHDRDGVLKAKSECFDYMNPEGYVILNGEDDKLDTIDTLYGNRPYRFGLGGQDAFARDVENNGIYGTDLTICTEIGCDGEYEDESRFDVHISIPGVHMVGNALAATVAGRIYGMDIEDIKKGIEATEALSGRSHVIQTGKYTVLDDCYNANGKSMKAAIDMLKTANGRKVAVLGDMFELGEKSEEIHRSIGAYAASNGIEVIICTGKNSKAMYEAAMGELMCEMQEIIYCENLEELKKRLPQVLQDGDSVLVKASHGMKFAEVVKLLTE